MDRKRTTSALAVAALLGLGARAAVGCGGDDGATAQSGIDASAPGPDGSVVTPDVEAGGGDAGVLDASGGCTTLDDATDVVVATAASAGEHALILELASEGATQWSKKGSEALVLEIKRAGVLVGHVVVH